MKYISDELNAIKESGLYRELNVVSNAQGVYLEVEGRKCLSFCSNNYLGQSSAV